MTITDRICQYENEIIRLRKAVKKGEITVKQYKNKRKHISREINKMYAAN